MSLKKLHDNYKAPTSAKWRKVGDSFLLIGSTVTSYAIFEGNKTFALISLACTVVGKVITNFTNEQ
jgi:hypothetical protein